MVISAPAGVMQADFLSCREHFLMRASHDSFLPDKHVNEPWPIIIILQHFNRELLGWLKDIWNCL